jgi:hypothetical protein
MTENEYAAAVKQLIQTVIVGVVLVYGFFILLFVYDIH